MSRAFGLPFTVMPSRTERRRNVDWRPKTYMPCACGGWLAADSESPRDVTTEVRRHNATGQHDAWAAAQDFPGRSVRPMTETPAAQPRDSANTT